jgi:hypothetical protein
MMMTSKGDVTRRNQYGQQAVRVAEVGDDVCCQASDDVIMSAGTDDDD